MAAAEKHPKARADPTNALTKILTVQETEEFTHHVKLSTQL